MEIPVTQLLIKMDEHIRHAGNQQDHSIREHIMAIRTLCDLILDHHQTETINCKQSFTPQIEVTQLPVRKNQDSQDDANGDSIFDF